MSLIPSLFMRRAVASHLCACALPITFYTHTEIIKMKLDLELFKFNAPKMAVKIVLYSLHHSNSSAIEVYAHYEL